jgi:hypothetical protein
VSQTETNTNTTAEKNLIQLANEERLKAGWGPAPRPSFEASDPSLSKEEREAAVRRDLMKYAVSSEVRAMIGSLTETSTRPVRLLALPEVLARDEVMGANVTMRILVDAVSAGEHRIHEFINVLRDRARQPTAQQMVQKLNAQVNGRSYLNANTTLAEAFWLGEVVQWFQCMTSNFGNVLANLLINGKELTKIDEIEFTRKLTYEDRDYILREAMDQQYGVLETLLHRI